MKRRLGLLPPFLLFRAAYLWLCGRIHFPKDRLNEVIHDKGTFLIFRQVLLGHHERRSKRPGIRLTVRFQFRKFSLKTNKILSIIPIPFIVAQPGFRSKIWMFETESGEFQGLYEWDTSEDAKKYRFSFPMKLMKKRALPESLIYEIMDKVNGETVKLWEKSS